ncbi:hypothetical protein SKAU_G00326970 [Synaphobranchus kaupii]|uniref:Uncharacterized protein n=1 Tax=Synaphobranchus kaupii TaxID=118154 RepID=A0A9Q1EPX6_SYNKA|nr:hypothetical protein SKAU_G00326970 [Synaphobranchus kaupii]
MAQRPVGETMMQKRRGQKEQSRGGERVTRPRRDYSPPRNRGKPHVKESTTQFVSNVFSGLFKVSDPALPDRTYGGRCRADQARTAQRSADGLSGTGTALPAEHIRHNQTGP